MQLTTSKINFIESQFVNIDISSHEYFGEFQVLSLGANEANITQTYEVAVVVVVMQQVQLNC